MAGKNENNIGFEILTPNGKKKRRIEERKKYRLPERATCVHVYAGMICFGYTNGLNKKILKTNRGIFFKKPDFAKYVCFFDFKSGPAGFNYGEPIFLRKGE